MPRICQIYPQAPSYSTFELGNLYCFYQLSKLQE
ncbi:unnamed protein product [Haemonchus placei]|uniref:Transposase n=1 Tax=Haemonchus placei TaxID=6290 RepID=A0A0N4X468_HAEPC|nr:unnamed protein product [Haemonchus placei]